MIRLIYSLIVASGLGGIGLGGGWLAVKVSHAAAPVHRSYEADPTKAVFHVAGCPYLLCDNPAHFPHLSAAEAFGQPCEHCLAELAKRD